MNRPLAAGTAGKRFALPHSRIMVHQPSGGFEGTAADISIQAQEILRLKDALYGILSKHTGRPAEEICRQSDRDFFMSVAKKKQHSTAKNQKK